MNRTVLRQTLLGGLLALSLAASWWVHQQEQDAASEDVSAPVSRIAAQDSATPSAPAADLAEHPDASAADSTYAPITLDLRRLHSRDLPGTEIDPFRAKTWFVPPPPPPPEPPPKPTAPPLPFQFVGQTEEVGGKPAIYLANGNEFYTVSVGDKFAGSYQLERIDRGALVIRYLPLSIIQSLPIGNSE